MQNTIKIAKYLAECGIASRRKSEEFVAEGRVKVNGKTVNNVALRIDPKADSVEFGGRKVTPNAFVYYLLNKPLGYTSTNEDRHAQNLVTELVPQNPPVWTVGRLDKYTSGLIILTNDGALTQRLTHPSNEVEKEYEIIANPPLGDYEIKKIQRGIKLEDGFVKPDRFEKTGAGVYRITLHSGKKRVVRRLMENVGRNAIQLKRTRVGFLTLENLKIGQWRPLADAEIARFNGLPAQLPR